MGIENRGKETKQETKPEKLAETVRNEAANKLVENLFNKLTSEKVDLRDQDGNPVELHSLKEIMTSINRDGTISLTQEIPDQKIEQIESKSKMELLKQMGAEKIVESSKKMNLEEKEKYLDELSAEQMSANDKLEEAEAMLREAETPEKKSSLEKKISELRGERDGYNLLIDAVEKGTIDIKQTEMKLNKKMKQEIVVPAEITKKVFDDLPEDVQKKYISDLWGAINSGEGIIEEYKGVLEAKDTTDDDKEEAQKQLDEEAEEVEARKNLIANLK